ncbi:uncharacterized protein LOC123526851 [Mercenaria mercenaria]|uniref:uncharacterized protein LOC123526851 n=1 Tax=Mercenaria mercenaria TaxID=6596 RepID=UPI00234F0C79|nr:uncharacterized protein LOC123526851 [Mercenaria mercenaria]
MRLAMERPRATRNPINENGTVHVQLTTSESRVYHVQEPSSQSRGSRQLTTNERGAYLVQEPSSLSRGSRPRTTKDSGANRVKGQDMSSYEPVTHFNHLFFVKPPEGFRDILPRDNYQFVSNKTEDYPINEKNDKVVVILQNILRNLENDIEHDRKRLKEERRKRQKERRRRREERREAQMAASRAGSARHVFSTVNHKPFAFREGISGRADDIISHVFRRDTAEIRKHDSLSFADISNKTSGNEKYESFLELGTRSLDRKAPKRSDSFGVSDWSRYSRDVDDDTDADVVVCVGGNSPQEVAEDKIDNTFANDFKKTGTNRLKRQTDYQKDCLRKNSPQFPHYDKRSNNLDTSTDSQGTPANIKKKLKSFDILPNYRKTGKGISKSTDCESKGQKIRTTNTVSKPSRVCRNVKDDSVASSHDNESSSDNDDSDIVFPSTEHFQSSKKDEHKTKDVNFRIGHESDTESDAVNGYLCKYKDGLNDRTDFPEAAVVGPVAKFRRKHKVPSAGTSAVRTREAERPTSAGTSGYSTDEYSCKASDSEDECLKERKENEAAKSSRHKLSKYFLVLQNGINMALKVDDSAFQNGDYADESCRSFLQNISMSDLAIPDHVGWLVDQSEQSKVWGVVVDMLFCVFECEGSAKPRDVIILPGCSIRPLVYNTAINGLNTNTHSQTITGISKFQFVIDDSSTGRKHVFGAESQYDLDTWYRVLKKASALDPEITNDISTSSDGEGFKPSGRRVSFDGVLPKLGYIPSQDATRRSQRMRSPRGPPEKPEMNGTADDISIHTSTNGHDPLTNGNQPSPRSGLVRSDSRRQSISDFKKLLRQETKPEVSKQLPVKATHFKQPAQEENTQAPQQGGKKLKSFGSFESLLKFKRKKRKPSEDSISNDDGGSIVSGSSTEQEMISRSVDISANMSQLQKQKGKKLSRSLEYSEPKNGMNNGIVRRASDIKDRVFNRRPSKPFAKLGDLHDTSMHGFLLHKHHLKWQKLWCVVCRGCFYGFKSNSPEENAQIAVLLASCGVVFVSKQDKKQKNLYVFKLTQEKSKSIYLCATDYTELMKWLTVLQMESNSVISNADKIGKSSESENDSICSSLSSQSGSVLTVSSGDQPPASETSRSRSKKKKKAPAKPPRQFRNSSCPPSVSRDSGTSTGEDTLTSGSMSSSTDNNTYGSTEELPRYDRAVTHVWQNDRGYLFNAIRAKLTAYRKKDGNINNKELPGADGEGLMVVQDGATRKGSKEVRRSRSFNAHSSTMSGGEKSGTPTPTESPTYMRKRHKPLVVKKIAATDLEERQTIAGYIEKKSVSAQWIRYWYVLHEGTLFCYLTTDDNVTVDVLNLHGYTVASLVDKFRGKRFVLQLSHENFTSLYLSMESREEMENWRESLEHAIKQPSSAMKEVDSEQGACAGCESNRQDDVGEKRKQVKQKLLEEVLRQKYELERKQAERQKKQRSKGVNSPDGSPSSSYPPDLLTDEQRTSDVTRLRQRRMSTQLKVETIQKQIEKPSGTKRGLFGFGKSKKLDENKNVFLQDQLKELNDKLHKIDTDLNQVESEKNLYEGYDVNQNRKSMPVQLTSNLNSLERGVDSEDDEAKKANSLKNTMQKWTTKTFSKVSVKRKQGIPLNGSLPNLKQNGEINMNGGFENGENGDTYREEFTSLENSVTDLTRPMSDLKLDLSLPLTQNGQNGSASPSSVGYNRSNSRTSTLSSLSSPRREIDPSVLAEIDAFEELTKQVLGARSKETAAK